MTLQRAVIVLTVLAGVPWQPAAAQFGGMPGMPGSPGMGMPGMPGFGGPPAAPPPACQRLLELRDQVQREAGAIQAANKRKASAAEACKLFRTFLATETKLLKGLQDNMTVCGVPAEAIKQSKAGHAQASQIGKQVCDVAAQGDRPVGPSLSDVLGTPPVPDPSNVKTGRGGAFDTLSGNVLAR